ncbi:hypothetical protein Tco_0456825, partial [Tanacetum coccineum]
MRRSEARVLKTCSFPMAIDEELRRRKRAHSDEEEDTCSDFKEAFLKTLDKHMFVLDGDAF